MMGCDHVPGTVMEPNFIAELEADPDGKKYVAQWTEDRMRHNAVRGTIDGTHQLAFSRICYGLEEDGACINEVEAGVIEPGRKKRPWLEEEALALLFGKVRPAYIHFRAELGSRDDGRRFYRLSYRAFTPGAAGPRELRLHVSLPDEPLSARRGLMLFKMRFGSDSVAFPAAEDVVLTGSVVIGGKQFEALVQRDARVDGLSQLWLIVRGRRLRID
jgi:hypothetical protein